VGSKIDWMALELTEGKAWVRPSAQQARALASLRIQIEKPKDNYQVIH